MNGEWVVWEERLLVVYSPSLTKKARRGLAGRLDRAERELQALTPPRGRGKRQWDDLEALQGAVQSILQQRRVEGLLEVTCLRAVEQRDIRRDGDRSARTAEQVRSVVQVQRHPEAIAATRHRLG